MHKPLKRSKSIGGEITGGGRFGDYFEGGWGGSGFRGDRAKVKTSGFVKAAGIASNNGGLKMVGSMSLGKKNGRAIAPQNSQPRSGQTSVATSYLLWLVCLFGVSGVHRFYNGKVGTGFLWLITWGWFGFGQFIDLVLIPEMVDEHNLKRRALLSGYYPGVGTTQAVAAMPKAELTEGEIMKQLVQAASQYGGKLSVTQGVMATGLDFDKVEAVLSQMLKSGYVSIGNDPNSGVVLYDFHEI